MKILFVQPYMAYSGVVLDTLPGKLAERGHEVLILSYFRKNCLTMIHETKNLKISPMPAVSFSIPNVMTEFPYFLSLETIIKQYNPDIIHANNLPFLTTYQSVKIAKKLNIPSVIQVHGVTAERGLFMNAFQFFYLETFANKMFDAASKVICLTQADASQVQSCRCALNKLCIIPNFVDTNIFKPNGQESKGLIVWIGRFVSEKGLVFLIKAINLLVTKGMSGFRLLLIGDGPLKPKVQSQIRTCGLEQIITLIPSVTHDKVSAYLQQASIFVLPSLKEGMPYVLLEAMACGKAVVGSNIAGIKDVITNDKDGVLVPPKNSVALADAIMKLLKDDAFRKKIGANARYLMVENFDSSLLCSRIECLYDECISSLVV